MSTWIICSDLHLTSEAVDEYRWGVFPFLTEKIQELSAGAKTLFILGDLAQQKDYLTAKLVNRLVWALVNLYRSTGLHKIIILRGNHDGVDGKVAFFEFLNTLAFIKVVTVPEITSLDLRRIALLPHTKTPSADWAALDFAKCKYIFMHATAPGAIAESGTVLEGDKEIAFLKDVSYQARILSGDVHVPQRIGKIEYIGAPYPIRFGDDFEGRILVLQGMKELEWHYPTIRKVMARIRTGEDLNKYHLRPKDQVNVIIQLKPEEGHLWIPYKEAALAWFSARKIEVVSIGLEYPKLKLRLKGQSTSPDLAALKHQQNPMVSLEKYCQKGQVVEETAETGKFLLKKATTRLRFRR